MDTTADGGRRVSSIGTPNERNHHMDPNHIHAWLTVKVDEDARLEQLERYFAVRAEASQKRRGHVERLRRRLAGRSAPRSRARATAVMDRPVDLVEPVR